VCVLRLFVGASTIQGLSEGVCPILNTGGSTHPASPWHWIWRRRDLSVYEKAVLTAIRCEQFRDNPVVLSHERIAALASISRRKVMECEKSLQRAGMLQVKIWPGARRRAKAYRVMQVQKELFSGPPGRRLVEPGGCVAGDRPQTAMGNATKRCGGTGAGAVAVENSVEKLCGAELDRHHVHDPPGLIGTVCTSSSGSSSGTSNTKTRAEVRPREQPHTTAEEKELERLRWEWRQAKRMERIERDEDIRRELAVGSGPELTRR
jgi:hypothetical protein